MRRLLGAIGLAILTVPSLGGCDFIAGIAGAPEEVEVSTGGAGQLAITPEGTSVASANVSVGRDLPNLFDIDDIDLPEGSVTFEASAATASRTASPQETCNIAVSLFIDGVRAADGQVAIEQTGTSASVTSASLTYANGYSSTQVCSAFPSGSCPATSGDYDRGEIIDAVTEAIQSGRFDLDVAARNPGSCVGTLRLAKLTFGLDY